MFLFFRLVYKPRKQRSLAQAQVYALDTQFRELSWQTLFAWHEAIDSWPLISLVSLWSNHLFPRRWQRLWKHSTSLLGAIKIVNMIPRMDLTEASSQNYFSERYRIITPLVPHMRISHFWTLFIWKIIWKRWILNSPRSTVGSGLNLDAPLFRLILLLMLFKSWRRRTLCQLMIRASSRLLNLYWWRKWCIFLFHFLDTIVAYVSE